MTQLRIYGAWAGNPRGTKEDTTCCIAEVWPHRGWTSRQCLRKRGHGPDGLYCKQHAKKELERQEEAR